MDGRILIGVVLALVLVAFGGFYFALAPHPGNATVTALSPISPPSGGAEAAHQTAYVPPPPPPPPPQATAASIEAEFAFSEQAQLLALLKKSFPDDYDEVVAQAVRRRNEGVSEQVFGQELAESLQGVMRAKLKYGAGASMPTIDRLAANEASLFHALGTEGAAFCLKMLGRDDTPAAGPLPASVRQLMTLGTLYRFQTIAEGQSNTKPIDPLTKDETRAYAAALTHEGLNLKDVSTGAYFKEGTEPGKPCLTLETLHLAIARLPDGARRKIYASMFFAGR